MRILSLRLPGFTMGILFGEWWLAKATGSKERRRRLIWTYAMAFNCMLTAAFALDSYRYKDSELPGEKENEL